jgi:hypothetical protein
MRIGFIICLLVWTTTALDYDRCSGRGDWISDASTCLCQGTYGGQTCQFNASSSVACPHQTSRSLNRVCPITYSGDDCSDFLGDCASSPCSNGGACYDQYDSYACDCDDGLGGTTCSEPTCLAFNPTASQSSSVESGVRYNLTTRECYTSVVIAATFTLETGITTSTNAVLKLDRLGIPLSVLAGMSVTRSATTVSLRCIRGSMIDTSAVIGPALSVSRLASMDPIYNMSCGIEWTPTRVYYYTTIGNQTRFSNEGTPPLVVPLCSDGLSVSHLGAFAPPLFRYIRDIRIAYNISDQGTRQTIALQNGTMPLLDHLILGNDGSGIPVDIGSRAAPVNGSVFISNQVVNAPRWESCRNASRLALDRCRWGQCQNGATCIATAYDFQCVCPPGFIGPLCVTNVDDCISHPCQNGGTCSDGIVSYVCTCSVGYSGAQCQTDINECASSPCQNGGTCLHGLDLQGCICPMGYSGLRCQTAIDLDECLSLPCQNGGTCLQGLGLYACSCVDGYSGTQCQDFDDCISHPCQNGGTCLEDEGQYGCVCPGGFSGQRCQTNIDDCVATPCQHGATCNDGLESYTCTCAVGFSGLLCQTNVDECTSTPCWHGGTCVDQTNGFSCICLAGYSGAVCQTDLDECASAPCLNGGSCQDQVNGFQCTCVAGWSGVVCQTNVDECASSPCHNGGTCQDQILGYACSCQAGYSGVRCQTDIDECASEPCQNGGSCVDQINAFSCACGNSGYSGSLCQTDINECASNPCQNGGTCIDGLNSRSCVCPASGVFHGPDCSRLEYCDSSFVNVTTTTFTDFDNTGITNEHVWFAFFARKYESGSTFELHDYDGDVNAVSSVPQYGTSVRFRYQIGNDVCLAPIATAFDSTKWFHVIVFHSTTGIATVYINGEVILSGTDCASAGGAVQWTINGIQKMQIGRNTAIDAISIYTGAPPSAQQITDLYTSGSTFEPFGQSLPYRYLFDDGTRVNDGFLGLGPLFVGGVIESCHSVLCDSNPCQNGGTCSGQYDVITCACPVGYSGVHCQTNINECASNPCQNGGNCEDGVNSFQCYCVIGFSGVRCQTAIDECASVPCQNGGTCVDGSNGFSCTCTGGFTGTLCEIPP